MTSRLRRDVSRAIVPQPRRRSSDVVRRGYALTALPLHVYRSKLQQGVRPSAYVNAPTIRLAFSARLAAPAPSRSVGSSHERLDMQTKTLELIKATPETVAPYGVLIAVPNDAKALPVAFYEGTVRVFAPFDFVSDSDTQINLASIDQRPQVVRWLERHFKHTQTFIPLAGRPFIMVVAPPTEGDMPDVEAAQALLFDGSAGFGLHIGTWHEFPFAQVDDTRVIVILRGEATRALMKDTAIGGEAHSGDLDKKDIQVRLGMALEVSG